MSIRSRLRISIVSLVTIVVIALSAFYLYDFTRLAFEGAEARATHVATGVSGYVLDRIHEVMTGRRPQPANLQERIDAWTDIVKTDPYIASMLQRSAAHANIVVSIQICDSNGATLAASTPRLLDVHSPDTRAPVTNNFNRVNARNAFLNLWDLFRRREDYTVTLPIGVSGRSRPVFTIVVVVRSVLLADVLRPRFVNLAMVLCASFAVALFLASLLPNLVMGPLERVSQRIDLIRTGQFEAMPLKPRGESSEFAAVQTKLSLLGQQFRGARQDALDLRQNIDELLQKLEEAVLLFDNDGNLIMAGSRVERLLGKARDQILGRRMDEVFPATTLLGALIRKAFAEQQPLHDEPITIPKADAAPAQLLVNIEILRHGPDARQGGVLVTLRDAGTRRQIEMQLDVSSRLAAINRLTGGIAHEIKNPLNAIALHLEVLRSKLDAANPEIDVISREIKRLDHVVKTFLNFNRPIELKTTLLDLSALAADVVSLVRPEAEGKNIRVETQLNEPVWINADLDLLRQAVMNVIVNAVEAMQDGGLLSVRCEHADKECCLLVADSGSGIPPAVRDKIFNLYFTTKQSGSGIGLAMTYRAVQLHGGTIDLTSEPDQGACFKLRFPAAHIGVAMEA